MVRMSRVKQILVKSLALIAASALAAVAFNTLGGIPLIKTAVMAESQAIAEGLPEEAGIHLIGLAAARSFFESGTGPVLDARPPEQYDQGHLPGAINCFVYELEQYLPRVLQQVAPDTPVMLYCSGEDCEDSYFLAQDLKEIGFKRLYVYKGGYDQWLQEGLPVVTGDATGQPSAGRELTVKQVFDFSRYIPGWAWLAGDFLILGYGLLVLLLVRRNELDSRSVVLAAKLVGFIFVFASLHKIASPLQFARIIENYHILPAILVNLVAVIMPWVELFCGILLLSGCLRPASSTVLLGLTGVFILAIGFNMIRGLDFDCGCFGSGHMPPWRVLMRDIGLFILIIPGILRE